LERDLVARAQRGDEPAFAELVERVGDRLYAVAQHILRDPGRADDAAQQAMIEIWRKLPSLKDPDRFLGWAYRIVVRAAYAEAASRRRWFVRLNVGAIEQERATDHAGTIIDRDELDRALGRLPIEHRAVLVLKHYAGLSNGEISDALGIPQGTVRSRLYYATSSLRAALEADWRSDALRVEPE